MSQAHDSLAKVYREHGHVALRRARKVLGNASEAEEVVQELFLKLAEDPAQLARADNPMAWLYVATTHACFNRIRNQKTRMRLLQERSGDRTSPDHGAETRVIVARLLSQMSEEWAEVLVYYHVDQMSHAEIAEVMGCSRRHIGDVLERATAFARNLDPEEGASS